jgi:MYXO-CTERM domain-containing protein
MLAGRPSRAVSIVIQNADMDGQGFNDQTQVPAIGENMETTRGGQALAAFNLAAKIWGDALGGPVEIRVRAQFAPMDCAVLGEGSPTQYSVIQNTLYPVALASQLTNTDQAAADASNNASIEVSFNGALGTSTCPQSTGWYFGLDGQHGNLVDLVSAVLHELGHGLGMITPMNLETGEFYNGTPDIFATMILDDRSGKSWSEMSPGDRATSARNFHHLVWSGMNVTAAVGSTLHPGMPELALDGSLQGLDPAITLANFQTALPTTPVQGVLSTVASGDACGTPAPLEGKVAFVETGGSCSDVVKALAVQGQGAVAAILVSSQTGFEPSAPAPGTGDDPSKVMIPVVAINQADADMIRAALPQSTTEDGGAGPTAKLWNNPGRAVGTSPSGQVFLDATDPVKEHTSVTHWDPMIMPPLLMQPEYVQTNHELDLTLPLMHDLGWPSGTGGSGTISGIRDGGVLDGGDGEVWVPNPNPPPPNRYLDAALGPETGTGIGPGGIPWATRPSGCNCRVETAAHQRGAGLAAMLVGLAALIRRRNSKKAKLIAQTRSPAPDGGASS